jgi:protein CpxP
MKKFLMPLLALALTATAAAAQDAPPQGGPGQNGPRPTPEAMATRQTEGLTKQLGLSPDQSSKVQQILLARGQEMMAMRGQMQAGTDRRQLREQMQANRAKYDDQFKQVLTPDQYGKFTAMEASRRQRGPGRPDEVDGKVKQKDGKVKIKAKSTDS